MMHGQEKSGLAIVAENRANMDGRPSMEGGERRAGAKGNTNQTDTRRTPSRASVSPGLERVRTAARLDKEERFTALLHHVDIALLRQAYLWLKREAAPGVDGVTWAEYGQGLEEKLEDLHGRVQRAVVEVLNAIYEEDFLGFSYGFRPGRSQHNALDALAVGITRTRVNWILDADIRSFFDTVSHEWLIRFVEHRIGDRGPPAHGLDPWGMVRLIHKWLKAGVMEAGE